MYSRNFDTPVSNAISTTATSECANMNEPARAALMKGLLQDEPSVI